MALGRSPNNPFPDPPRIVPLQQDGSRPYWSVMIPAYNPRADHLEQALKSVLMQDPGPERMQIEVVDDCSPDVDVAALVKRIAGDRVACSRSDKNLGLAGAWNKCVERSRGTWVHILHQDDYVGAGFYQRIEEEARAHPEVGLIATRSFVVDSAGVILHVGPRVPVLENGGRSVSDFYYKNPLWFPGVVVHRDCYEWCGGFRGDLIFALDVEMWTRAISQCGGLVLPDVLAFYRAASGNETSRLFRTAEAFNDMLRLFKIYGERYTDIDMGRALRDTCWDALAQAEECRRKGDREGEIANRAFWRRNATPKLRLRRMMSDLIRRAGR